MQTLDLSCAEDTPAGHVIGEMHYRGFLGALLLRNEYSGGPHNGGTHELRLKLDEPNLDAFFELVPEFNAYVGGPHWHEWIRQFSERATLLRMGADAPIMDVLEYFHEGPNWYWAVHQLKKVQEGLEGEGKPCQTLGDLAKYTSSEVSGPQCRYCGNKTQSWMGWVMRKFGLKHKLVGC